MKHSSKYLALTEMSPFEAFCQTIGLTVQLPCLKLYSFVTSKPGTHSGYKILFIQLQETSWRLVEIFDSIHQDMQMPLDTVWLYVVKVYCICTFWIFECCKEQCLTTKPNLERLVFNGNSCTFLSHKINLKYKTCSIVGLENSQLFSSWIRHTAVAATCFVKLLLPYALCPL